MPAYWHRSPPPPAERLHQQLADDQAGTLFYWLIIEFIPLIGFYP